MKHNSFHRLSLSATAQSSVKRTVKNGTSTNDLVFSASKDGNEDVFPRILSLYVNEGSVIADVTYGKGVFWRKVNPDRYIVLATDKTSGVDCRDLPYKDGEIDCLVLDPPYMHTPGGTAHSTHHQFEQYYKNNNSNSRSIGKYHEAVLDLYFEAARESLRVLRYGGVFIVKCQDEVCSNRQRLTHVELIIEFEKMGFKTEDLFVVMRRNRPGVSRVVTQVHARKNHSYFLVLWKPQTSKQVWKK